LRCKAIIDGDEGACKVNRVQCEKTGAILNISDKKSQKNREIDVAEQQGHRD
jgi:hypothetical protein